MAKLILWNLLSLDGFFEGDAKWSLEWMHPFYRGSLEQFGFDQLTQGGAILFGRTTYEGMAQHWSTATDENARYMNTLPKVVFSKTLPSADWANTRLIRTDAAAEVRQLKQQLEKDILVFGSGILCNALLDAGLFDELRIGVVPLILGSGTPLFPAGQPRPPLTLLEAIPTDTGVVILRYAPHPAGAL